MRMRDDRAGIILPPSAEDKVAELAKQREKMMDGLGVNEQEQGKQDMDKARMVGGLRELAELIENGQLTCPEFIAVVPVVDGEARYIHMGKPTSTTFIVGMIQRMIIRLSLG